MNYGKARPDMAWQGAVRQGWQGRAWRVWAGHGAAWPGLAGLFPAGHGWLGQTRPVTAGLGPAGLGWRDDGQGPASHGQAGPGWRQTKTAVRASNTGRRQTNPEQSRSGHTSTTGATNMAKKAQAINPGDLGEETAISISPLKMLIGYYCLLGTTPLITNRKSRLVMQSLLVPPRARTRPRSRRR